MRANTHGAVGRLPLRYQPRPQQHRLAVEPTSGELTPLGQQPTVGTPRAFGIDPVGNFMLVGGLDDGDLATYRMDSTSGRLTHIATQPVGDQPMWVHITDPVD